MTADVIYTPPGNHDQREPMRGRHRGTSVGSAQTRSRSSSIQPPSDNEDSCTKLPLTKHLLDLKRSSSRVSVSSQGSIFSGGTPTLARVSASNAPSLSSDDVCIGNSQTETEEAAFGTAPSLLKARMRARNLPSGRSLSISTTSPRKPIAETRRNNDPPLSPRRVLNFVSTIAETPVAPIPNITRSYSDGDLSEYLKGFSELKDKLRKAKSSCDTVLREIVYDLNNFIEIGVNMCDKLNTMAIDETLPASVTPSSWSPVAMDNASTRPDICGPYDFSQALSQLIAIANQILEMDNTALQIADNCKAIITKIQVLQTEWRAEWPCREFIAKILMSFSNVTRLVEHLEADTKSYHRSKRPPIRNDNTKYYMNLDHPLPLPPVKSERHVKSLDVLSRAPIVPTSITQGDNHLIPDVSSAADLREQREQRDRNSDLEAQQANTAVDDPASKSKAKATITDLQSAADEGQSWNILMEWTLEGEIQYISPACTRLTG